MMILLASFSLSIIFQTCREWCVLVSGLNLEEKSGAIDRMSRFGLQIVQAATVSDPSALPAVTTSRMFADSSFAAFF